jgi:tetratricopeptide (TPR) repeat protein
MGLTYYGERRWPEARQWFEKGLAGGRRRDSFLYNMGLTYLVAGELVAAAGYYRTAVAEFPDFVPAHLGLGRVLERSGDWKGATEQYAQALELEPGNHLALQLAANLWNQHGLTRLAARYNVHYGTGS